MTLNDFLSETKESDTAFGSRIGLSQSQVSRLRRGVSRPSWNTVEIIHKATGGKVTLVDWSERTAA